MKKTYIFFVFIILLLFFLFFSNQKESSSIVEDRGVFISYIEIEKYLKNQEEESAKMQIRKMIQNVQGIGANMIILQVRPSSDAIYPSKIFPWSRFLTDSSYSFDVLDFFLKECHKKYLKLFAWINPYRIHTQEDLSIIQNNHPAYPYLETDLIYVHNGVYYNPAREEVTQLILDGVKEVLEYPVDGILFDDYFYPSKDIDLLEYEEYSKKHSVSLEEYHYEIINQMICRVHDLCQEKGVMFGVSPDGNIQNNYDIHFADVKTWLKDSSYVDFIMPQLYYGFLNEVRPFLNTSLDWEKILLNNHISYYVSLAFYKVGKSDPYAKAGENEWIHNNNILLREIIASRSIKQYRGFALFRYDNIFDEEQFTDNSKAEIDNLKKILK